MGSEDQASASGPSGEGVAPSSHPRRPELAGLIHIVSAEPTRGPATPWTSAGEDLVELAGHAVVRRDGTLDPEAAECEECRARFVARVWAGPVDWPAAGSLGPGTVIYARWEVAVPETPPEVESGPPPESGPVGAEASRSASLRERILQLQAEQFTPEAPAERPRDSAPESQAQPGTDPGGEEVKRALSMLRAARARQEVGRRAAQLREEAVVTAGPTPRGSGRHGRQQASAPAPPAPVRPPKRLREEFAPFFLPALLFVYAVVFLDGTEATIVSILAVLWGSKFLDDPG